ncbi:MAG: hypothetical protein ACREYF_07950 [Gammaproteobacteria bacterium]
MGIPKWISWAGLAAILGGLTAIVLTGPFTIAYFSAYPSFDVPPFWIRSLKPALTPLLTFASPVAVYNVYGRIYDLVYLLFLPATFGLHHLQKGASGRVEKWGFGILVAGLLAALIGNAGDYWADGAGFFLTLLGLLTLSIGVTLYGVATLRSKVLPTWCSWLLIASGPGAFVFLLLIGHIPSGPTFLFAVSWLIIGYMLLFKRDIRPQLEKQGAG